MKTQAPEQNETAATTSWWDRATDSDASAARGKRLLTIIVVVALGLAAFLGIKGYLASQEEEARNTISDLILEGELLLPTPTTGNFYGRVIDAGLFFRTETAELRDAGLRHSALGESRRGRGPEKSEEYRVKIEALLADFNDREASAMDGDQAWQFMNVRQQLCWYAAVNATETKDRIRLLEQQLQHLETIASKWPNHPVLSLVVDPSGHPGKSLTAIWRDRAVSEKAFWEKLPAPAAVTADENLSAVLTLDNGKALKIEFFSMIAPRTVANFVKLAQAGFYNGTAFHSITETACTGGDPFSKICPDRPRIWGKGGAGYVLPRESSILLDVEPGSISMLIDVRGIHGSQFSIHTADAPGTNFSAYTVFARITEGLETIQEYVKTDTIDDEQAENPNLPVVGLRIKSLVVTGTPTHRLDDSWSPALVEPEAPETTDEEKRLEKEAKDKAEGDKKKDEGADSTKKDDSKK